MPLSVVAIFCEDIRTEASGQDTIVGTLPDNLQVSNPTPVPNARAMIPRLGVYLRINFSVDDPKPKTISAKVLNMTGELISESDWAPAIIDKAFADAEANQMPLVGFLLKMVAGPLHISGGGKIKATVTVDETEYVAGVLNIIAPSASAPPASQSPTAS